MLAGGLKETVPVSDVGGDHYLVVPVDVKTTTARAVLSHIVLAGGLLKAVPVGGEGGDPYLVVLLDVKVATDRPYFSTCRVIQLNVTHPSSCG